MKKDEIDAKNAPEGVLCAKTHEWVLETEKNYTIGLTDYAVEQLGDIVFVELPEVETEFAKGEVFATIESVKAASEIYMPIGGKIVAINEDLINSPELVNENPWESGWLVKIESMTAAEDSLGLMEYEDYLEEVS
ncbi:glycine cleavage system H protein [Candidatus Gastranaerophilus sp. (ex Termes propinquus)]|nr:glycine cleavage system H protein [Candidatus Gastranaerophilus sp. (ex Termes propinquus)]